MVGSDEAESTLVRYCPETQPSPKPSISTGYQSTLPTACGAPVTVPLVPRGITPRLVVEEPGPDRRFRLLVFTCTVSPIWKPLGMVGVRVTVGPAIVGVRVGVRVGVTLGPDPVFVK